MILCLGKKHMTKPQLASFVYYIVSIAASIVISVGFLAPPFIVFYLVFKYNHLIHDPETRYFAFACGSFIATLWAVRKMGSLMWKPRMIDEMATASEKFSFSIFGKYMD